MGNGQIYTNAGTLRGVDAPQDQLADFFTSCETYYIYDLSLIHILWEQAQKRENFGENSPDWEQIRDLTGVLLLQEMLVRRKKKRRR